MTIPSSGGRMMTDSMERMMTESMNGSSLAIVTGAGGFIGSHLTQALLEEGWRVRALVHYNALGSRGHLEEVIAAGRGGEALGRGGDVCENANGHESENRCKARNVFQKGAADWLREKRLEVVAGDVQDARCMRELVRGARAVFHLAALIGIPYSYAAPQSYVQTNILGTLNVLEACRDAGVERILHTSTSEALGTALREPQDESHPLQAQSPYSATKIGADKLAESYHLSLNLPVTIARPFNTYGPRQSARAVIPTILAQALSPDCPEIRLGSLAPRRDLTFVDDTVRAFIMLAQAPIGKTAGRLFHLGTGQAWTIGEVARLALEAAGVEKPIVEDPARQRPSASEVMALVSDNSRIRREIVWAPQVSLRDGLARTVEWMRPRLDRYRPAEYTK